MKFIFLFLLLATSVGNAQEKETPPTWMENGEITVVLKDGSKSIVSTNDFKVVPRVKYPAKKVEPQVVEKIVEVAAPEKLNRVIGYVGYGPDGLRVSQKSEETSSVSSGYASLIGVGYARKVYQDFSVNGILTRGIYQESKNVTGLIGLGKDF